MDNNIIEHYTNQSAFLIEMSELVTGQLQITLNEVWGRFGSKDEQSQLVERKTRLESTAMSETTSAVDSKTKTGSGLKGPDFQT